MRRSEKEITDRTEIDKILHEAEIIHLAMIDGSSPYLVALNFVYADQALYMHSAREGRKIDILTRNNSVAFQTETGVELVLAKDAWNCSTHYKSVFGTGKAFLIDEKDEKKKALDLLMTKHKGQADYEYPDNVLNRTLVIKVEIDSITGKKSGE